VKVVWIEVGERPLVVGEEKHASLNRGSTLRLGLFVNGWVLGRPAIGGGLIIARFVSDCHFWFLYKGWILFAES